MSETDNALSAPLAVTHPHLAEFTAFLPELDKETDRGMVLIATSFIDEARSNETPNSVA
jgi:hypothetical protein